MGQSFPVLQFSMNARSRHPGPVADFSDGQSCRLQGDQRLDIVTGLDRTLLPSTTLLIASGKVGTDKTRALFSASRRGHRQISDLGG